MFSRISTIALGAFIFSALATASPAPWGAPSPSPSPSKAPPVTVTVTATAPVSTVTTPASQCNTGGLQCCKTVESSKSKDASALLVLLGIVTKDVLVGLGCSPISVIGGGANCVQQPVCCENNNFSGLINIGCTPINLAL